MKDSRGSHMLCQTGAYCTELTLRDQCMCAWFHKRSDTRNDREMDDWMFVHVCRARGYCKSSVLNKNTRQCPRPGLKPGLLYSVDKCTHHEATTTPYRDLFNCLLLWKVNFRQKCSTSGWEISISCSIQEYNDVMKTYYPIFTFRRLLTRG